MLTTVDKALAVWIAGAITAGAQHIFGYAIGPDLQALIVTVIGSVLVYAIPNKEA